MTFLSTNPLVRKDIYIAVLMMFIVPLAGEVNFYPINETFRVSFGVPTFFFFLLLLRKMTTILPGFLTAVLVVGFRILIDLTMQENFDWITSFQSHYPTFFFYFTYACLFYLAKVNRFHKSPLIIGFIGIIIEILSDFAELFMQYFVLGVTVTLGAFNEMFIIALSHSFIVLGFFNILKLYEAQSRERQMRKQNEHMLMLISNLYEESIHLKKTLQNAETITRKSYELYRGLNQFKTKDFAPVIKEFRQQALQIAGEVHEIKKDNQRIFAGLSRLISNESFADYIDINKLINIIVRTNEKYARLLEKNIQFLYTIKGNHPPYHIYTILSIINNLVANAVEAIQDTGTITICIDKQHEWVEFYIYDDGP
ncbi:ATP-binding protein, partial [Bacillus taeanensis]